MRSLNPSTGELLAEIPEHDDTEVERRLAIAAAAFPPWRALGFEGRARHLTAVAARLRSDRAGLARLLTLEMGKPIGQAEAEVEKCAWVCAHFAEHAERYLAAQWISSDASHSYVRCDPLGGVLAIMPWNFPLWQVFRCVAPALMAGNVVVLKHASNVPQSALAIEQVFTAAGLPEGVFTLTLVSASRAEDLIDHPVIAAVSLTGSEAAGVAIGARAGRALKKCVLELGGSDPFLVLADADPEEAAAHAVQARLVNNGQSCIAAKRFIAEHPVAERFEQALARAMAAVRVGDPLDPAVTLGPLARDDLRLDLADQVGRSVASGARLLTGGLALPGPGFFFAPTVVAGVEPGMAVADEETFGPVAAVLRARDAADAVRLANGSRYGLGASVWTRDVRRAEELAAALDAGAVFVNGMVKSDPRLPFGGVKHSGYGRELSAAGIREFVNIKTVWVR